MSVPALDLKMLCLSQFTAIKPIWASRYNGKEGSDPSSRSALLFLDRCWVLVDLKTMEHGHAREARLPDVEAGVGSAFTVGSILHKPTLPSTISAYVSSPKVISMPLQCSHCNCIESASMSLKTKN